MVGLDYGYRSKCCYAPIRLGRRKVRNSTKKFSVWVCCKCKTSDVDIVEYTKGETVQSTLKKDKSKTFIPDEYEDAS